MAKNLNRGLPSGFSLDIPEPPREAPVNLGDYLDEADIVPVKRPVLRPHIPASNVVEIPVPKVPDREAPAAVPSPQKPAQRSKRKLPKLPARKQINATPETLRMIDDLIDHVQTYSVQRDAKASEIFHALVLALHEAKSHIDLSEVPSRGKWGTPTAQAFPISLKGAFQDAIAQYRRSRK